MKFEFIPDPARPEPSQLAQEIIVALIDLALRHARADALKKGASEQEAEAIALATTAAWVQDHFHGYRIGSSSSS